MAPSASLLFHPKVKKEPKREILDTPLPLRRSRAPTARPSPKAEPDDVKPALPEGPFQEFKLMSCDRGGWRYDVMKFDARRPVDIQTWQRPVKVNRKELRRDAPESELAAAQAVGPMLGPDGNPVVGADGRMVMVDADGRPIHAQSGLSPAAALAKKKEDMAAKKKKFQKKTKQVFLVPDEVRKLRREERYPWVIEDGAQQEVWVGMMEDATKSNTHALFMPDAGNVFKFVPAHRWYKFQKKPSHIIPTLEEAEKMVSNTKASFHCFPFTSIYRWRRCRKTKTRNAGCFTNATAKRRLLLPLPSSAPERKGAPSLAPVRSCTPRGKVSALEGGG